MPFDRDPGTAEIRLEARMAVLAVLAAGLAGDVEAAEVIFDTTSRQALLVEAMQMTAEVLIESGHDPAQWVADRQAECRARLAEG